MFILLEGSLAARAWLESAEVVGGSFAKGIFASALPMIDQSVLPAVGQARLQRFWSMILAFAVLAFISLTPASAAVPERNVYYTYDVMGRQLTAKFDSASGADGITNTYNGFGDQLTSTVSMAGFSKTVTSAYDGAGRRAQVTHPDAQAFTYGLR